MDINELTVGQVKEIVNIFGNNSFSMNSCSKDDCCIDGSMDYFCQGESVIVRTFSAGVWCGTLKKKSGNEVILENARRMWRWFCKKSISLSGVVGYGIVREKSKIAAPVPQVWLEAIEIMPISGEPLDSIMGAEIVEAE